MEASERFDHLSQKIGQLFYSRRLGETQTVLKMLEELNFLNYRSTIVKNPTKAVLLINQCCSYIHPDDETFAPHCAQLIANLLTNQNISLEGRTLTIAIQWCLNAYKYPSNNIRVKVLTAIEALIRNDVTSASNFFDTFLRHMDNELNHQKTIDPSLLFHALKCVESMTSFQDDDNPHNLQHIEKCASIFISFLRQRTNSDSKVQLKILGTCLAGLINCVISHPDFLKKELGLILGICKTYMVYGIKDVDFLVPEKIMPTTLNIPEITQTISKEKTGGKLTKQRKHRNAGKSRKKEKKKEECNGSGSYLPVNGSLNYSNAEEESTYPAVPKILTSDSDFSETEGVKAENLTYQYNHVRQYALNLLSYAIRFSEKSTIFAYWCNFIPVNTSSGKHHLLTCILKDLSSRGKMCALSTLLTYITSVKMYLPQAETSEKLSSFTPFSVTLGLTLIELHKTLCLALGNKSIPVLAQTLKCLSALVQSTPYHKMSSGLITKVVRNVKEFIFHKDASVQVTALIVLGCILAVEPSIPEIKQVIIKVQKPESTPTSAQENSDNQHTQEDFDYVQFSSDEDVEPDVQQSMSWLLERCLRNLGVNFDGISRPVPAPVKQEALQVLSAMSRNYFEDLLLPHLHHITKAIETSLMENNSDLKLHGGRAVDFLGQAMSKITEPRASSLCLNFWLTILDGPLITLIQDEQRCSLRSVGCDCIGSIGYHIFQQFPRNKQILCVTLLFASTKDEEATVRGAAIRALALCILYPSLREDPGFVVDTAQAIMKGLKDETSVKIRAAWSLGNLSDALVLGKFDSVEETLPEKILSQLLNAGIECANDNDRIKINALRSLGNFISMMQPVMMKKEPFNSICLEAMETLIKAGTTGSNTKARWNACYALGNALKNPALYTTIDVQWQSLVFPKLSELVVGYKNFKVRINAALALSSPTERWHYGQYFIPLWSSMLQALENSQHIDDLAEYKHRDNLVEQICLCLGHLTSLLTKDDLTQLESPLTLYLETFKVHMHKVVDRLVPEKSADLFSATCAVSKFGDGLGTAENRVVEMLQAIFSIQ